MSLLMKIEGLVSGGRTAFDGQYLMEYDPGRDGFDPATGLDMTAHIVTTPDPGAAMKFEDLTAFHAEWTRVDPRTPTRPDGRPNRPLTAFTVSSERWNDDDEGSSDDDG